MTTYYKDFCGATASITEHKDGTATLKIRIPSGKLVHNKVHKNQKAAYSAWRRYCA